MATDLERLIVTVEANTRQFTRAMNELRSNSNRAMNDVENVFTRAGERMGIKFGQSFRRGIGSFLTLGFIKDALEAAAAENDPAAQHALDTWNDFWKQLKIGAVQGGEAVAGAINNAGKAMDRALGLKIGPSLMHPSTGELTSGVAKQINDRILGDPQAATSELNTYLDALGKLTTYVNKISPGGTGTTKRLLQPFQRPDMPPTVQGPQVAVYNRLQDELNLLGKTNEEQAIYNNLKAAGVTGNSEWGTSITALTSKLEEQKNLLASIKEVNDGLEASTKTFAEGLLEGQSAAESLNAALRQLASTLLDMALHSLFNPGGTPLLQTLFGGITGSLGSSGSLGGRSGSYSPQTVINVQGSVDQKTLAAMSGMIQRNNVRQNQELQRTWGNRAARYAALRGP
jgi:hypothetical protein